VYDFSRCKLCAEKNAIPTYALKNTTIYVCAECGFHFINHLDTMPSENPSDETRALDKKSYDYIEGKLTVNGKQHAKNLLLVRQFCSLPESRCLDIGAGAGLFTSLLAEAGALVHGIEPQKIFREFALKKFGITLNRETIDDQRWQNGSAGFFDVITLWDVFEHVNFPAETLEQVYNVTREGGWLFLDTPRRDSFFYRLGEWSYRFGSGSNPFIFESIYSSKPFRHKQIFTLHQLIQLMEKAGFSVIRVNPSFFNLQNKMTLVCRKPVTTSG
jgi:2-polyprenyl-6-hydroxyphenyl methylase/3-demethylubiquinone-9 3-methyltransferase